MARWITPQVLTPAGVNHHGIGFDGDVGHFLYRDSSNNLRHRKTTNGGRDWTEPVTVATLITELPLEHSVAVKGDYVHVVFERADDLIYLRSTDGGATWQPEVTLDNTGSSIFFRLAIRAVGSSVHLVFSRADSTAFTTDGLIYLRSEDNGATWDAPVTLAGATGSPSRPTMSVDAANGTLYATCVDGRDDPGQSYTGAPGEVYLWRSTDGGDTWSEQRLTDTDGGTAHRADVIAYNGVVTVTWQDPGPGGGGDEEIFKRSSTDGGQTWGAISQVTTTTVRAAHAYLANNGDSAVMVYTNYDDGVGTAKVRWSTDCGQTWGAEETPWETGSVQAAPRSFYTSRYVGIACEFDNDGAALLLAETAAPSRGVKVGSFRLRTTAGQQTVGELGLGGTPQAGIFWITKAERDGIGTGFDLSIGVAVGATQRCCISGRADDTPTTMDTCSGDSASKLLRLYADATGPTLDCEVDFVGWGDDSFTIDVTDAPAADYIVSYMVFSGLAAAEVFSFQTVAAATQDVTSLAAEHDLLILLDSRVPAGDHATLVMNVGVAARGSGQGAISIVDTDNVGTSQVETWQRNDSALIGMFSGTSLTEQKRGRITSWLANGFRVTWDTQSADAETVRGLALKFNAGQAWVGAETQATAVGTKAKTGVGFKPDALLALSTAVGAAAGIARRDGIVTIGAADAAEENVTTVTTDDNAGLANTNRRFDGDKFMHAANVEAQVAAEADLYSFDADGWTLNWQTADATAREMIAVAVRNGLPPIPLAHLASSTVLRAPVVAPSGSAPLPVAHLAAGTVLRSPAVAAAGSAPVPVGSLPAASVLRAPAVVPAGAAPVAVAVLASATVLRAPTIAGSGSAPLPVGRLAAATVARTPSVDGVGSVALPVGHLASAAALYAPVVAGAGATVEIPHLPDSTAVRAPTVAPTGSSPLPVGALAAGTVLRSPALAPSGTAPVPVAALAAGTALRSPNVTAAGSAPLVIPRLAAGTVLRTPTITSGSGQVQVGYLPPATTLRQPVLVASGSAAVLVGRIGPATALLAPDVSGVGVVALELPRLAAATVARAPVVQLAGIVGAASGRTFADGAAGSTFADTVTGGTL